MSRDGAAGSLLDVDLAIEGMTCASCVARVEKRLGRLDGVNASVNLATARARVTYPAGMAAEELIQEVAKAGYGATIVQHADVTGPRAALPAVRLLLSAVLSIPIVLLAMVPALQFEGWQWASLVLATPVVLWGGAPFHRATLTNLRHGAVTMDTLVTLGTGAAFVWSVIAVLIGGHVYFEVAAVVTVFLLLGRYIEERSKRRAGAALRSLAELGARTATRLAEGDRNREEEVPVAALHVGDLIVVRPGEKIATDGVVVDGFAAVDASALTGESVPVDVSPGDPVAGGTIALGGSIVVRATRIGAETQLARMTKLVEDAQLGSTRAQRLADRISSVFVPVVIALSGVTVAGWLLAGGTASEAFTAAVAVLIVACPCALGLATPIAVLVGTGRAAQLGILVTGPEALERTRQVDTVVFDKTGTMTTGRMAVTDVVVAPGETVDEVMRRAVALERGSEHPIARAVVAAGAGAGDDAGAGGDAGAPVVSGFRALPGNGVTGIVDGVAVAVGRPESADGDETVADELAAGLGRIRAAGATAVAVSWGGRVRGIIGVGDTVRADAVVAVARLREVGIRSMLVSGDHEAAVARVAEEVGIDEFVAGVSPTGKAGFVRRLQESGRVVAMVGDGVNDAAALAVAGLGIAMGSGTDVAREAGDLTLVGSRPSAVVDAIVLSRRILGTIRGNMFWAFAYNVAVLPIAAFGLLDPMIAGAAMAFSSVFVVLNSLRLGRFRGGGVSSTDG